MQGGSLDIEWRWVLTGSGSKLITQTLGLGRKSMMIGSVSSEVGAGTACPRGCTGFDGIVGGQVSEPCPRGT